MTKPTPEFRPIYTPLLTGEPPEEGEDGVVSFRGPEGLRVGFSKERMARSNPMIRPIRPGSASSG